MEPRTLWGTRQVKMEWKKEEREEKVRKEGKKGRGEK